MSLLTHQGRLHHPQLSYAGADPGISEGGGGGGGHRKGVGVPPPARSAEALSNIAILTHIHNEKLALIT